MSLAAGTRLGPYEIVALLGAGGMGEVYRALDPRLGRQVAVKILQAAFSDDPDRGWRFEREARAVASLNHPNICTVHDIGEHEGHRYLVMELMEGQPLSARLASGPLPLPLFLDLSIQVADALDAAHGAGVIHRDLKPANIFVTKRGEAKLLDFGLAKLTDADAGARIDSVATHLTTPPEMAELATMASPNAATTVGTLLGTAAYMSPEQARGEPADAQSDLFSFGAVLYEAATGRPAFTGKTMAVLFDAILNKDPKPVVELIPNLPAELSRIIAKALEKDRELRYRNAADIRADLKRLRRDVSSRSQYDNASEPSSLVAEGGSSQIGSAPPALTTATPASTDSVVLAGLVKRHRASLAGMALLVVTAIGGGTYMMTRTRSSTSSAAESALERLQVVQLTQTGNASRPAISPDGKYVVYLQGEADGGSSVWLRQTGTANSVKILPADPQNPALAATIGPGGTFVDVQRARGLWRVPFLGGTPKLIFDSVSTPVGWSPDGQHMAFIGRPEPTAPGSSLVMTNPDGGEEQVVATRTGPAGGFATGLPGAPAVAPAWSPDGKRIAALERLGEDVREMGIAVFDVSSRDVQIVKVPGDVLMGVGWIDANTLVLGQALEQGTPSQLWRIGFPDGRRSHLTNDVSRYEDLSLSGDRDSFVSARPEARVSIWVGDATGSGHDIVGPAPFLSSATQYATVGWDGTRVFFTHTLNGRFEIFRVGADGAGSPETVVAGRDMATAPDGSVVYRTITGDDVGLWRVDRDGRHPTQLAKGSVNFPMVTPDGQTVIFSSPAGGTQSLWRVPLAGGSPSPVFGPVDGRPVAIGIYGFSDISPDGRSIAIGSGTNWTICDFPACTVRKTIAVPGLIVRWMPDGRGLSFIDRSPITGATSTSNLWVQPIDGSARRQLTHFDDGRSIGHYAWSRDGRLAIARASMTSDSVLFRGLKGRP